MSSKQTPKAEAAEAVKLLQTVIATLKDTENVAPVGALLSAMSSPLFHKIADAQTQVEAGNSNATKSTPAAQTQTSAPAAQAPAPAKATEPEKKPAVAPAAVAPAATTATAAASASATAASSTPTKAPAASAEVARDITLVKGNTGLGFNIVGGLELNTGIFVSRIMEGGTAHKDGRLRVGDEILEVDSKKIRGLSHEGAASALKATSGNVNLKVIFTPKFEEVRRSIEENKARQLAAASNGGASTPQKQTAASSSAAAATTPSKSSASAAAVASPSSPLVASTAIPSKFYVRALFDFAANKEKDIPGYGLGFKEGDILFITNANDDEWWEAQSEADTSKAGLIPSRARVERKERARNKSVKFGSTDAPSAAVAAMAEAELAKEGDGKPRGSIRMAKKLSIFGRKDKEVASDGKKDDAQVAADAASKLPPVLSYEWVVPEEADPNFFRPLVVLGPVKDVIYDKLLQDEPDKYSPCVPHTTRAPRPGEENGREYFFISREQMENDMKEGKFMEAGQFKDNLYGTSIEAVRSVVSSKKHCIVDVSGSAVETLRAAKLRPLVIFLKLSSLSAVRAVNPSLSEDSALKLFEASKKIEVTYRSSFTDIVKADRLDEIADGVKKIVQNSFTAKVWIATNRPLP